jgi:peptide/nickel transport system substrate-binding protein
MRLGRQRALAGPLLVLALAACDRPSAPAPGRGLRVVMAPEVSGLDPHRQTAHGGDSVMSNVYEALTAFDEEMRVIPGLAVRWESPEELTWRFHLRPGVSFHDGRPLTAAAVVKSLDRARGAGRSTEGGLAAIREVKAPAVDMVEIRTVRRSLMLLNTLATAFIVPEDAPDEITTPIGTGPYRFVSFEPGRVLELAANDGYGRNRPSFARLSFLFEPDPERRREQLASGSVDVALRLAETASEQPGAGYRVVWRAAPGTRLLGLRVDRPPFSDPRLRKAVSLAIDREGLSARLLAGRARAVGQVLPRGIFGYAPDVSAPSRDLVQAKELLRGRQPSGLEVTLDHGQGRQFEAEAIAASLGEAGLRVTLRPRAVPTLIPSLDSGEANLVLFSYILSAGDTETFFQSVIHSRNPGRGYGAQNLFGYGNREVDALIEAAENASPLQERLARYQAALRLFTADRPVVPLWEVPWVYGLRDDIAWSPVAHGWFDAIHAHTR